MPDENEQTENNLQPKNAEVIRPQSTQPSPQKKRQPQLTSSLLASSSSSRSLTEPETQAKKKPVAALYNQWQRAVKNSAKETPSSIISEIEAKAVVTPKAQLAQIDH